MPRLFLPGTQATVAKPFAHDGKTYARGDAFPYRKLGMIDHNLRGLWLAGLIEFPDPTTSAQPQQQQSQKRAG